tara:strand:- start:103 stop:450 length:348 start_codon:yes stop_codon:yes gene_type:complete
MKISKKKLKTIIKEEMELAQVELSMPQNHDSDGEGRMAKRQLTDVYEYSGKMLEMLSDDTDLKPWVQAKITIAADYIKTVKHYLEYEMKDGSMDQVTPHYGANMPDIDDNLPPLN